VEWYGATLPLKEQLRAAAIAGCQALSVTPAARCASGLSARRCSDCLLRCRAPSLGPGSDQSCRTTSRNREVVLMPRHAGAVPLQIIGPLREIVGEIPDQSVHDKGPWRTLPRTTTSHWSRLRC